MTQDEYRIPFIFEMSLRINLVTFRAYLFAFLLSWTCISSFTIVFCLFSALEHKNVTFFSIANFKNWYLLHRIPFNLSSLAFLLDFVAFRLLTLFSNLNSIFFDIFPTALFIEKYIKFVGWIIFTIENRLVFFVFR